jgi:hypothetical protein
MALRPAWVSLYGPIIARLAGSDIPLALLLGHVQHESAGNPKDRTKLDERGLFQIHPGTSKEMGFDHSRMFEPFYNIEKGIEMYRRMADRLQRDYPTLFPARSDLFWRVVRFEFSIGSGAVRKILRDMIEKATTPRSWSQFEGYLKANQKRLFKLTKHDPVRWAAMVNRVFVTGARLAEGGSLVVAGGGVLALGLLVAVAVILFSHSANQPQPA